MASLRASSRSSSSSYRSSSTYSSSFRSDTSLTGSSDSLDKLFLDSANCSSLFGEAEEPDCVTPLRRHGALSGAVTGGGGVHQVGDTYYTSADVSQFEPHDVVVMAYKHHVVVHAQKVLDDGNLSNTFSHTWVFPEDMDPLSVSGSLSADGSLIVSVQRVNSYRTEAYLSPSP